MGGREVTERLKTRRSPPTSGGARSHQDHREWLVLDRLPSPVYRLPATLHALQPSYYSTRKLSVETCRTSYVVISRVTRGGLVARTAPGLLRQLALLDALLLLPPLAIVMDGGNLTFMRHEFHTTCTRIAAAVFSYRAPLAVVFGSRIAPA